MTDKLQMAVNAATDQWMHARARMQAAGMGGGIDNKRNNAWCEYGYKEELCFHDFYKLYSRNGVAHGAIERIADKCWESDPEIIEGREQDKSKDKTEWEVKLDRFTKRTKLWERMKDADKRRMVGRYAALIVQVRDSKLWSDPLDRALTEAQIVRFIPAWEGQLFVTDWNDDMTDDGYGEPKMYQYNEGAVGDSVRPRMTEIHPSRVIILGDIRDGTSMLEAGFNAAVNMEKILGGSGESFLKNAARQLAVEYDKDVQLDVIAASYGVSLDELATAFHEQVREINRGNDVMMLTQGGKVNTLVAQVPDPASHYDVALQDFSASMKLASKIIVGNQTGERASTQDLIDFGNTCMGRRNSPLSSEIEYVLEWLMRHGVIEKVGELSVIWSDLNEQTLAERLESVVKMVDANQKMLGAGVLVFTEDEIRQVAGYDAKEQTEPLGEDIPEEE